MGTDQVTTPPAPSAPAPTVPSVTSDLTQPGTPPPASVDPAASATPAPAGTGSEPAVTTPAASEPKVLTIPTAAMKRLKDEEREKGRTDTLRQLDAEAQGLGFASYAEMKAFAQSQRSANPQGGAAATPGQPAPGQQPAAAPQASAPQGSADDIAKREREAIAARDKAIDDQKRLNRQRNKAERENRQLKQRLLEQEVHTELKLAAKDAGVVDVDYAVEVLNRAIKGMSEAELQAFDEAKFFREQLRQSHPHLYQVQERPVTTGTGNSSTAKPAQLSKTVEPAANGQVDAKKMSPQQFQELLRKRGLSDPTTGGMLA